MGTNNHRLSSFLKSLLLLSKPGIIRANILTLVAGYLFSQGKNDWHILLLLLVCTSLIIAGSCMLNNVYDADIDALMIRTKKRKHALEIVGVKRTIFLSAFFIFWGTILLFVAKLYPAFIAGLSAFIIYVFLYTPLKKRTPYTLQVGTVPGALSLVAGYSSKSGFSIKTALVLFVLMYCWQIVHFLGIALYRKEDYKNAHIPTYSNIFSSTRIKIELQLFCVLYFAMVVLLCWQELRNVFGGILAIASGLWVLYVTKNNFYSPGEKQGGKKIFLSSLSALLVFCVIIVLQGVAGG